MSLGPTFSTLWKGSSRKALALSPSTLNLFQCASEDYFNIEDRWIRRLNDTMRNRQSTKAEDLEKLYETLERARSPTGLLTVKIGEMESGRFIGKVKPDKATRLDSSEKSQEMKGKHGKNMEKPWKTNENEWKIRRIRIGEDCERLARKFKLDDHVASRFTELIYRRKTDGEIERMHKDVSYSSFKAFLAYFRPVSTAPVLVSGPKRCVFPQFWWRQGPEHHRAAPEALQAAQRLGHDPGGEALRGGSRRASGPQ